MRNRGLATPLSSRLVVPALFFSVAILYLFPMVASKNIFVERDLAAFFIPPRYLWVSLLKTFQFPLWNPHNYCGIPLLATLQPGVFYPPHVLYLILPFNVAWNWIIILHFFFAGFATFLFLRSLSASREGAFLGGILFMLSGYLLSVHNLLTHLLAVVWLPIVMASIVRYFATKQKKYMVFAALSLAIQFSQELRRSLLSP
jgi:uncharacterized membrane protein